MEFVFASVQFCFRVALLQRHAKWKLKKMEEDQLKNAEFLVCLHTFPSFVVYSSVITFKSSVITFISSVITFKSSVITFKSSVITFESSVITFESPLIAVFRNGSTVMKRTLNAMRVLSLGSRRTTTKGNYFIHTFFNSPALFDCVINMLRLRACRNLSKLSIFYQVIFVLN